MNESSETALPNFEFSMIAPPEAILKKIKNAWVAGIISIIITLVFALLALSGANLLGLDAFAFVDIFLMIIFTFGIYKKSRISAILMLALFAANKIFMWLDSGSASGLPLALVFLYFYGQGVLGTFQYHNYMNKKNA